MVDSSVVLLKFDWALYRDRFMLLQEGPEEPSGELGKDVGKSKESGARDLVSGISGIP